MTNEPQHSTKTRYSKGCRCDPCREAKAVVQAKYRQQVKERKRQEAEAERTVEAARVVGLPVRKVPQPVRNLHAYRLVIVGQANAGMTHAEIVADFARHGRVLTEHQVDLALRAWGTREAA
jgi:hypothetical protein